MASSMADLLWSDETELNSREHLGNLVSVKVYRLLEYSVRDTLVKEYGQERANELFRRAGMAAGKSLTMHLLKESLSLPPYAFFTHLRDLLRNLQMGILQMERFDPESGYMLLTMSEDLDCSGLPVLGETVCHYDEGFLAGVLQIYTGRRYRVKEIDCWATGSRTCRFEAHVEED